MPKTPAAVAPEKYMRALAHPTRLAVVGHMLEHGSVSPSGYLSRTGADTGLANVAYHMRALDEAGVLRIVKRTPRRGAIEHDYGFRSDAIRAQIERLHQAVAVAAP